MSALDQPSRSPAKPAGRGTLQRQLVVRVVLLVTAVALLLSAATTLATRQLLMNQVDIQLSAVTDRLQRGGDPGRSGGPRRGLLEPGQPIGTLFSAYAADGSPFEARRLTEDGPQGTLPGRAVEQLSHVPADQERQTVSLAGLGRYRVAAYEARILRGAESIPGTVVVGVPLAGVDETLTQLIGTAGLLSLLALVGAALAARPLVQRSLRPLNRVAATAQLVSQLQLDKGEVALAVRVPPEDANPRSEVGRVGQAFNHMLSNVDGALAARQASETKVRQFVADASHELRNPLAAIRGYAELTRRHRRELPPDTAHAMARVESEADRMSRLVEDLLLLARLDSEPNLDHAPVDLTELVLNAVSDARVAGPEHTWTLVLPETPVVAQGDAHRLHQVLTNLLANARTHTPPGTRVETGLGIRDGYAEITVTDDGPGIPAEIQQHVFERFTRADTSRARSAGAPSGTSTGLGLAIVAAVVDAHDGNVAVESRPGRTVFTVRLARADP